MPWSNQRRQQLERRKDMSAQAIERRKPDRKAAIEAILGTGDMRLMVEQAKANAVLAVEFARQRGYVSDYDIKNKEGKVVGQRAWFHLPTWQLLAQSWGITAFTEGEPKEMKPGLWEASAVAQIVEDGRIVGRSVGLCSRNEPGKSQVSDHNLSATAQSRAQRNALRSCLGAILIAAGIDIVDPEGPATHGQIGTLHQLEKQLGMTHEEGHARAGVESYKDLTREQAAELIEAWSPEASVEGTAGADNPSKTKQRTPEPSTDDLEDPYFQTGPEGVKGKRYSEVARSHPDFMKKVVTEGMVTGKRRELAKAHLDRAGQ